MHYTFLIYFDTTKIFKFQISHSLKDDYLDNQNLSYNYN